jgi:nitrite reductase/ring-hydroxylating ferredoxin subunit
MSDSGDDDELLGLRAHLAVMAFPEQQRAPAQPPTVPFAALPALPEATRRALEQAALESNDRYLETFLEPSSFCPFSRGGRAREQTRRFVHYADTAELQPFLDLLVEAASDPSKVVIQVIVPLVEVSPEAWSRFCHAVTAVGNELLRAQQKQGKDTFAIAPLHPELPYSTVNPFAMIPLFRRTPDPTIQWVRLDALEQLYEGRTGDTEYVDADDLATLLSRPKRSALFERIAESNLKMAERLGVAAIERTLRELSRSAHARYTRLLLGDAPETLTSPVSRALQVTPFVDAMAPRAPLRERDGRWALVALADLAPRVLMHFLVAEVELIAVRIGEQVHVLHGRCPHRNAPLSTARVEEDRLVCRYHEWDFRLATGESEGVRGASIARFATTIEDGCVWVDGAELQQWRRTHAPMFGPGDDVL